MGEYAILLILVSPVVGFIIWGIARVASEDIEASKTYAEKIDDLNRSRRKQAVKQARRDARP